MNRQFSEAERKRRSEQMKAVRATQSREQCVRGGKTRGDLHAINKTGVCGRSEEQRFADGQKGGLIGGPIAGANPRSREALLALCNDRQHQRYASHCGQHVKRCRPNPRCEFCSEQSLVIAFA
jgi:hypothetical protein